MPRASLRAIVLMALLPACNKPEAASDAPPLARSAPIRQPLKVAAPAPAPPAKSAAVDEFLMWAVTARKAPRKIKGREECNRADDFAPTLCMKNFILPGGAEKYGLSYGRTTPAASFRFHVVAAGPPLVCASLGETRTLRRWVHGGMLKEHCAITAGELAGLQALVQHAFGTNTVWLFSAGYLLEDKPMATTLASEGT